MGEQSVQRCRTRRMVLFVCAVCIVALADATAFSQASPIAQRAGLKVLDLVVDESLMQTMQRRMVMSEAQAMEMRRTFDAYWQRISEIDARGRERALELGLRDAEAMCATDKETMVRTMERMRQNYAAFDAEQQQRALDLHALKVKYSPQLLAAQKSADAELASWLAGLREIGAINDASERSNACLIRRANFDDGGSFSNSDFQKVPDIIDLVEQASQLGGELERWRGNAAFEASLADVLLLYEQRVDSWLSTKIADARRPVLVTDAPYSINSVTQPKEFDAAQRIACDSWSQRYSPARDAVEAITCLVDNDAASKWRNRFLTSFAPELMKDRLPDALRSWLSNREDETSEQVQQAAALNVEWQATRDRLRQEIVRSAIAAKAEVQYLKIAPQPCPSIRRYAADLHHLHESALALVRQFVKLLSVEQVEAFEATYPALRVRHSDPTLGPPMDPLLLRYVTSSSIRSSHSQ